MVETGVGARGGLRRDDQVLSMALAMRETLDPHQFRPLVSLLAIRERTGLGAGISGNDE